MEMLSNSPDGAFSHESIAKIAGMGARTVYRHFPDRARLLQALWIRLRDVTNTKFPAREEDISPFIATAFREFDEHQSLVRAVLTSSAGTEVRERGGGEGRAAFARSLTGALSESTPLERARVTAVFVAVYSAPFWQLLRDRGGLSGPQAQEAGAWVVRVLLEALHAPKSPKSKRSKKK